MICNYRNCEKQLEEKEGRGRNKKFCNHKCKSMEQYHKNKEKKADE